MVLTLRKRRTLIATCLLLAVGVAFSQNRPKQSLRKPCIVGVLVRLKASRSVMELEESLRTSQDAQRGPRVDAEYIRNIYGQEQRLARDLYDRLQRIADRENLHVYYSVIDETVSDDPAKAIQPRTAVLASFTVEYGAELVHTSRFVVYMLDVSSIFDTFESDALQSRTFTPEQRERVGKGQLKPVAIEDVLKAVRRWRLAQ